MRWIIGDIHGMLRPLEALIAAIPRFDAQPTYYFVGDYVNRGKESKGVIEFILSLPNARFIRGNHDDVLDQVLHGTAYADNASHGNRFLAMQWFLDHGLLETLQSYGATMDMIGQAIINRTPSSLQPIIDLFPPAHRQFIHSLPVFLEDDDLFLIHGKWPLKQKSGPAKAMKGFGANDSMRQEILWGRFTDAELTKSQSWPKRGFFGHTPVPTYKGYEGTYKPIVSSKMVLLDTAAALSPSGRLSAYCADNDQLIQADPQGRLAHPA
ncbi:MAG TPA: metallophosphoesterase [Tepidisphaeraceae bacterium]|nr:metallophosphoesterase [Tepidisphaeraceae bacterium]